jgi:putative transposase
MMQASRGVTLGQCDSNAAEQVRSSYYRSGRSSLESRRIRQEVLELSRKHPRYGYRRITALMRREGFEVNAKRLTRIRREEGITVNKKQRRMKRLGISTAERQRAERPSQVWSWNFVADQTEKRKLFSHPYLAGRTHPAMPSHSSSDRSGPLTSSWLWKRL